MKRLLLLFAAMCCMAMMQAEIVYHEKCEPTRQRGFTQDCWEDTETGKIYSDQACTNELNAAKVVQYSKLANDPFIYASIFYDEEFFKDYVNHDMIVAGTCKVGDVTHDGVQFHYAMRMYHSFVASGGNDQICRFKVYGSQPKNAMLKMYVQRLKDAGNGTVPFEIRKNGTTIYREIFTDGLKAHVLSNVQFGDEIEVVVNCFGYGTNYNKYTTIDISLEYEPGNYLITADNLKKIKGEADPVLTWTEKGDLLDGEKVNAILSRTAGEEPGEYPIHVTYQTENLGSDAEIITQDATFTIFDGGIHHHQLEPTESQIGYAQDCWEDESTGKFYLDGYHTQEVCPDAMILYPKFAESPITQNSGFTIKESETYDGVLFNWVAVTNYTKWEQGTRYVEFTVHGGDIVNGRLKWFKDQGDQHNGVFHIYIYVNGEQVQRYDSGYTPLEGLFTVPLPSLKDGDIVKFQVGKYEDAVWGEANPTIAASLEYLNRKELCLRAEEAGSTVELKRNGATEPVKIQYSTDYANWTTVDFNEATTTGTITLANVGDKVYFRKADEGVASGFSNNQYQYSFAMTGKIAASGNVMSLIDNTCEATTIPNEYCFAMLFEGCTSLTSAPRLPATTLKGTCYWCMFLGCTNLTTPPVLPATTLAESCYTFMFSGCTKLATAPVLPATTLKAWCYNSMFENCTSLTTAPELPVTTLAEACYVRMFKDCTSLASAPELPATTMATQCYSGMFIGCTKLVSAPTLASASLAPTCYRGMFEGCTSLTAAPALPATELKAYCYQNMFSGCTNLKSAPTLSAMKMLDYCYSNMFKDCTSLTTAPSLPATTLAFNCYMGMFSGCTKLESAPELPATGMYRECYKDMFKDCTSLTTAPELPATAMIYHCYYGMFSGCTKLNHVKVAFTEWTDGSTYIPENWLNGVASTGTFVCPDALDKSQTGASYIPEGWTPVFEVKANNEPNTENHYATFYSGTNAYEVPEGVTAYTGVVDGNVLRLTPVADGIIPADEAVILKATQSQVYLPYTTTSATKSDDNKLEGTDEEMILGTNDYALSLGQNGVGFYLWDGKSIGANKAYLTLDDDDDNEGGNAKAFTFQFEDDEATSIHGLTPVLSEGEGAIYNLNGVRVDENYKGIVIKNGKKVLQK